MRPVVSVVIPMYNSAATIAETLASVRASTVGEWEAVVVDDGSTDDGAKVVERAARGEPRIRLVTRENGGLPAARNTGIEASRGEYLYFLDADDAVEARGLEWLLEAARETGAAYGAYELCGASCEPLGRQGTVTAAEVGLDELLAFNRMVTHAQIVSRRALGSRRFRAIAPVSEDYDLWLRLAVDGVRWRGVERVVCRYRMRPASMSKDFGAMARASRTVLGAAFEEARNAGWAERGVDLSAVRLAALARAGAFTYATMKAIVDVAHGGDVDAAAALMVEGSGGGKGQTRAIDAGWAAQTVCGAVPFGMCVPPTIDGRAERAWLAGVLAWWARCEREGWVEAGTGGVEGRGLMELSRRVVHPGEIVEAMLASAGVRDRAVVLGLGRAGRRAVRMCGARGVRVLAIGGGVGDGERGMLEEVEGATVVDRAEDARAALAGAFAGAPVLNTATDEREGAALGGALVAAIGDRRTARWTLERARLSEANLLHLRATARAIEGGHVERATRAAAVVE